MSQGSSYRLTTHMLDDVVCTAIPDQDFKPGKTFMKMSATRLRHSVKVGMSPQLLEDLTEVLRARIATDPPDKRELQQLLESLPTS